MKINPFEKFDELVENLATAKKVTIGFGLQEYDEEVLESLRRSSKYASIVLVCPPGIKIEGFSVVISDNPEKKLAEMLVSGEIQGVCRGTVDDFKTLEAYTALTGKTYSEDSPCIIEDALGHRFFLSPIANPQGWDKEERFKIALGL